MSSWQAVIGLEVHAQLQTRSKIFSSAPTAWGAGPNEQVTEICAGLPGVLPVLNREVVELAIRAGAALGCAIHPWSQFARKNYFYADLPKGYQISQYKHPICTGGEVRFMHLDRENVCKLTRIHMEEDAGKSTHEGRSSLIDLNRAGVPLLEIVSEPDLHSPEAAAAYLKELRDILRAIGVCDGNMEQGSLRCDANVSVRREGEPLGTRAEVKNLNSFRFVQRAIEFEIHRQIDLLESGQPIVQETRLYNSDTGRTFSMRSKEDAHDYRYFPDPDLPPLVIDEGWIAQVRAALPELPAQRRARYQGALGLSPYDAQVLTQSRAVSELFEATCAACDNPKGAANWVMNEVLRLAQRPEEDLDDLRFTPQQLGALIKMIDSGEVTGKIGKIIFGKMAEDGRDPAQIADQDNLRPLQDDGALVEAVRALIAQHPDQAAQLRGGKEALLGFFVGQLMRQTGGKADPQRARAEILKQIHAQED